TKNAMMTKYTTAPRKLPTPMAASTFPSGALRSGILQARQSPPPSQSPITGISRSLTTEVTTLPIAAPMMTATARASALVFRRNSTNPLTMTHLRLGYRRILSSDNSDVAIRRSACQASAHLAPPLFRGQEGQLPHELRDLPLQPSHPHVHAEHQVEQQHDRKVEDCVHAAADAEHTR